MGQPTAVIVNYNEPLLERCLRSLADQTIECELILVDGGSSEEQLELAREYCDLVLREKVPCIGRQRAHGVKRAKGKYIISCDSDSVYRRDYAERAVEWLQSHEWVRAGVILPHEPSPEALLESSIAYWPPYEFAFAFRKEAFERLGLTNPAIYRHRYDDFSVHFPPHVIGTWVFHLFIPRNPWMQVYTRMPTRNFKRILEFGPIAAGGLIPPGFSLGTILVNELSRL